MMKALPVVSMARPALELSSTGVSQASEPEAETFATKASFESSD
jgi:hypothetical protein